MAAHRHHGAQAPGLAAPELAVLAAGLAKLGAPGAAAAGLTADLKNEALGWQADGDEGNTGPYNRDFAHHAPGVQPTSEPAPAENTFSILQARLALRGFSLSRIDGANCPVVYTVTRWGLARDLAKLHDVAPFADRLGARA